VKLVHVTYHFEYAETIEGILDNHDIEDYARYSMMEGRDEQGKHFGTQVHPGNVSVLQAQVSEEKLDELMADLKEFKESKPAHQHLEALVLPIERRLE
jgi:hypothetical protein